MIDHGSWVLVWVAVLLVGAALGGIFFAGLWWTVRRGASSPTPERWFLASLILRSAIVLFGFYLVGAGQPLRLGLCMLGFLLARVIVLRATQPTAAALVVPTFGPPPCA